MSFCGASWQNGKMGFGDATGKDVTYAQKLSQSAQKLSGAAAGLSSQIVSAAMGNGFSMNLLSSDDLGLGGNRTGLLSFTIGGKNSGFGVGKSGGWDVSMSAMGDLASGLKYVTQDLKNDKGAQYYLANNDSKAGMAKITYVNYGLMSKNADAMRIAADVINGNKSIDFDYEKGSGHYGHADADNNRIVLNKDAIDIGADNLGKVGAFTGLMAREGFLIDANQRLGVQKWSDDEMKKSGLGAALSLAAFDKQKGVMDDLAKNMGIKYEGEWAGVRATVDYVTKTGDLSGFDATGRDMTFVPQLMNLVQRYGQSAIRAGTQYAQGLAQEVSIGMQMFLQGGQQFAAGAIQAMRVLPGMMQQMGVIKNSPQTRLLDLMLSGKYVDPTGPTTMTRVIGGSVKIPTEAAKLAEFRLGRIDQPDVFVGAAEDIAGITSAKQLAERLALPLDKSKMFTVIEFPAIKADIACPWNRYEQFKQFLGFGVTGGGAREWVIPNIKLPSGYTIRTVK